MSAAKPEAPERTDQAQASDEVLNLLEQASSLTDAIAADLGREAPDPAPPSLAPISTPVQSPAPHPPAGASPPSSARLNDLLNDPDHEAPRAPDESLAAASPANAAGAAPGAQQTRKASTSLSGGSQPAADSPPKPSKISRPAPKPAKTVSELETALEATAASAATAASYEVDAKPDPPRRRISGRSLARMVLRLPLGFAHLVSQAGIVIVVAADQPFSSLSPEMKRLAGLLAAGTFLVAAAAWLLPELLDDNPFQNLRTDR